MHTTSAHTTSAQCPLVRDCATLIVSEVARPGMLVSEAMQHCLDAKIPGIPFYNADNKIVGKVSLKYLLVRTCVPKDMRAYAHLISDAALSSQVGNAIEKLKPLMNRSVDDFVLSEFVYAAPNTPLYKALALMDKYRTGYFFVLDKNHYLGALTMQSLTQHMLDMVRAYNAQA